MEQLEVARSLHEIIMEEYPSLRYIGNFGTLLMFVNDAMQPDLKSWTTEDLGGVTVGIVSPNLEEFAKELVSNG